MVGAGEENPGIKLLCFRSGKLVRPEHADGGVRARSFVVELRVPGSPFVGGVVPVVPAFGTDVGGKLGVDVDDT
jgi:hypothetical protein